MKSVNAAVKTAIRSSHDVQALPVLYADWNMNRYVETTVTNTPSEDTDGNDIEIFPIESIVEPLRPVKGNNVARIGQSVLADDYLHPNEPRFYISNEDDVYKYWQSPYPSDGAGNITGVSPTVIYSSTVSVNKIVVKLENTWASPLDMLVQYTINGGTNWLTASSAPTIANDGTVTLYYNGTAWSSNRPANLSNLVAMNGIRLLVTRMGPGRKRDGTAMSYYTWPPGQFDARSLVATTGASSYFSLIELSARRETNLSDRLITVSDTFDAGESSQITPMGTITTNVSDMTLWNGDGVFSRDNSSSIYYGLIEPNVEMNLEYSYNISGVTYNVQQFKMFVDEWSSNGDGTVSVKMSDYSKYLKEVKPPPMMMENQTSSSIFYRIMDSIGFSNYNIVPHLYSTDLSIPVFYTDGESTAWEILDELAESTQSLFYFDSWGMLNFKTRSDAYNPNRPIDWTLRGATSGTELADITNDGLSQTALYEANQVKVTYQAAKWSEWNNGNPAMDVVWSPDDTVTLRSTPLVSSFSASDTAFLIGRNDAALWPYSGIVQINGELIRYNGKSFAYYSNGGYTWTIVRNAEEYNFYNSKTPEGLRSLNVWTGWIYIEERGIWNSEIKSHDVEASGYATRRVRYEGGINVDGSFGGFSHNRQASMIHLRHNGNLSNINQYLLSTRGNPADSAWKVLGLRIRFPSDGNPDQRGGLVFNNASNNSGYYIELQPTAKISAKERSQGIQEIKSYARIFNGNVDKLKSEKRLIAQDTWYDVDVYQDASGYCSIWVQGKKVLTTHFAGVITQNGRFGVFIRGRSSMDVEYLYAINRNEPEMPDDTSFLNRIQGAYEGRHWDREWVWRAKTESRRKKKNSTKNRGKFNLMFFDEFGPYVHEVREYDVKFNNAPVLHSKIYYSNDWSAFVTEYSSNAFGAKFVVANGSRQNAVMNGDDTSSARANGKAIPQQMIIYGRTLVTEEQEEVIVRNEPQIKSRGLIESEINSKWIQSKASAEALATWIRDQWSGVVDELNVSIFGNPLLEIGDLVAVEYAKENMTAANNQYFVTGISTSFESGVTTNVTLRRKV